MRASYGRCVRRLLWLSLALLVAAPAAGSAAEPPFREILFHAAAHERAAVRRLHEDPPRLEVAVGDLEAALRSLKWARRLAGEQLPPATARTIRHRLDD